MSRGEIPARLLLAEELSPETALELNRVRSVGKLGVAWACWESALCSQEPQPVREALFVEGTERFDAFVDNNWPEQDACKGEVALACEPLFRSRLQGGPCSEEDLGRTYANIGEVNSMLTRSGRNAAGIFFETLVLSAHLRSGRAAFFGSVREEAGPGGAQYRHDAYSITEGGWKIPIQVKSCSGGSSKDAKYDRQAICVVNVRSPLVWNGCRLDDASHLIPEKSSKGSRLPEVQAGWLYQRVSEIVRADSAGERIREDEALFLDNFFADILKVVDKWQLTREQPQP